MEDHTLQHDDVLRSIANLRENQKDLYAKNKELDDRVRELEISYRGFTSEMKGELKLISEQNAKLEGMFTVLGAQIGAMSEKVSTLSAAPAKKVAATWDKVKIAALSAVGTGLVAYALSTLIGGSK